MEANKGTRETDEGTPETKDGTLETDEAVDFMDIVDGLLGSTTLNEQNYSYSRSDDGRDNNNSNDWRG